MVGSARQRNLEGSLPSHSEKLACNMWGVGWAFVLPIPTFCKSLGYHQASSCPFLSLMRLNSRVLFLSYLQIPYVTKGFLGTPCYQMLVCWAMLEATRLCNKLLWACFTMCVFLCVSVCFCVFVCVCVTVHETWSCRRHFSCVSGFPITSSRFNPATSALSKDCGSENFSYLHIPPVARCNITGWPPLIHSHLTLTLCSPLQPERRTPGPEHIQVTIHPLTKKQKGVIYFSSV